MLKRPPYKSLKGKIQANAQGSCKLYGPLDSFKADNKRGLAVGVDGEVGTSTKYGYCQGKNT